MQWIMFIILGAIFFFAPFQQGLFFDQKFYWIEVVVMLAFVAWLIEAWIRKEAKPTWHYFVVFAIPFMYVLAFFFAESVKNNFDNWFRWITYASMFVILLFVRKNKGIDKWVPLVFQGSGIAIALFSFLGFLGWVDYTEIMLGHRLAGPYQYANAFAAVMGAYLLYSLYMLAKGHLSQKAAILYGSPLALFGTTFILTYSRGAYLVLPIAWLIGLFLLSFRKQLTLLIYSVITFGISLVLFIVLTQQSSESLSFLIMLLSSGGLGVLFWWLAGIRVQSIFDKWSDRRVFHKYGRISVSGLVVLLCVLAFFDMSQKGLIYRSLPAAMQSRIGDINFETSSALGRTGMYKDALRMSSDYPFGAGGDSWKILYTSYQKLPYYSNEIHNGYLEILLSTGWLGLIVFLSVFGFLLTWMWRGRRAEGGEGSDQSIVAATTALSMVLLHGFLDFDFSYGAIWFLVIWIIAMHIRLKENKAVTEVKKKKMDIQRSALSPLSLTLSSVVGLMVLVGLVYSFRFYLAENKVAEAQRNNTSLQQTVDLYESAYALNPYSMDISINLANVYLHRFKATNDPTDRERIDQIAEKMERLEPHNARMWFALGTLYAQLADWEKTIAYVDNAIEVEKFSVDIIQYAIDLKQQVGSYMLANGDQVKGTSLLQSAVQDYENYLTWYTEVANQRVPDRRSINLSRHAHFGAAKAYLELGNADSAFTVINKFNPAFTSNDIYDPEADRLLVDTFNFATLEEVLTQSVDKFMILSVRDEATSGLPQAVKEKMSNMGSKISDLKYRGSYVALIKNGKIVSEVINNEGDALLSHDDIPESVKLPENRSFTVYSAGLHYGNNSSILVDGVEYSLNMRGINIAVFDTELQYLYSIIFDTHKSDVVVFK